IKSFARLTPNESEQSKRVSADSDRRHERRPTTEDLVERESPRKRQVSLEQAHRLALRQHFHHRRKRSHVERLSVNVKQTLDRTDRRFRRGFESGETDAAAGRIEHAERRIVSAN